MTADLSCRRHELAGEVADFTSRLAGARTFAQPEFAALWRHKGGRPMAWLVTRGDAPVGVLPGVEFGRRPLARFQSMPDGGYGGPLWGETIAADARGRAAEILMATVSRHGYARIHIHDFYRSLAAPAGFAPRECNTTLVDLTGADWEPPDAKLVSQARRAEREGIAYEPVDWSRHGAGLWELVRHTERRHGRRRPFYPRAFYTDLAALAARSPQFYWVVCEHEGRAACSHIYLLEDGVLQGWQILFDKAYSWLKPNQYLRLEIGRRFAAEGVRRLNLGGTPENAPGLEHYKSRWGGEAAVYPVWERSSGLGRWLPRRPG